MTKLYAAPSTTFVAIGVSLVVAAGCRHRSHADASSRPTLTTTPQPPRTAALADPDAIAEAHSTLWEHALRPTLTELTRLLPVAHAHLQNREAVEALAVLRPALERAAQAGPADEAQLPPVLWSYVAIAEELLGQWAACAAHYERGAAALVAPAHANPDCTQSLCDGARPLGPAIVGYATCLARSGHTDRALEVLLDAKDQLTLRKPEPSWSQRAELWLRLGELQQELGQLEQAARTLGEAHSGLLAANDGVTAARAGWLRAMALDRAQRVSLAQAQTRLVLAQDPGLIGLRNLRLPALLAANDSYVLGLAYSAVAARARNNPAVAPAHRASAELAVLYFTRYLQAAPHSLWQPRVHQHLTQLRALLPSVSVQGTATAQDRKLITEAVRTQFNAIQACAPVPDAVFVVTLNQVGQPATPSPTALRLQRAADVAVLETGTATEAQRQAARTCMARAAETIQLPPITTGGYRAVVIGVAGTTRETAPHATSSKVAP